MRLAYALCTAFSYDYYDAGSTTDTSTCKFTTYLRKCMWICISLIFFYICLCLSLLASYGSIPMWNCDNVPGVFRVQRRHCVRHVFTAKLARPGWII